MTRINVKIDRLILRGLPHKDRHAFAQALQQELGHILSIPGNSQQLSSLGNLTQLNVGQFTQSADSSIQQLGTETARTITKGLLS